MVTVILLQQSFSRRSIYCTSQNVVDRDPYFAFAQIFLNSSKRSSEEASIRLSIFIRRACWASTWRVLPSTFQAVCSLAAACVLLNFGSFAMNFQYRLQTGDFRLSPELQREASTIGPPIVEEGPTRKELIQ